MIIQKDLTVYKKENRMEKMNAIRFFKIQKNEKLWLYILSYKKAAKEGKAAEEVKND